MFDKVAFDAALLAARAGVHFKYPQEFLIPEVMFDFDLACDAQPGILTVANSGIPAYLANYFDPTVIEFMLTPMKAAVILGESKRGDWTTLTSTFTVGENVGQVAAYGDHSNNGNAGFNTNYPVRQSFHYQIFTTWGEREAEMQGLAKLDWVSRLNRASIMVLNKFQNQSYFFGIANLQNYGLINAPDITAPITVTSTWTGVTTPDVIFTDVVRLFQRLQNQAQGTIETDQKMVLAISPANAVNFNKTNQYNYNVWDQIKKNFPNMRVEVAPEYSNPNGSGELLQLIAEDVDGIPTATAGFTEKMRAHALIQDSSSWKQKKSQGTWGTIIFRPVYIAQMQG